MPLRRDYGWGWGWVWAGTVTVPVCQTICMVVMGVVRLLRQWVGGWPIRPGW